MTTNQQINSIIDRMYSIRSSIRGIYLNSSSGNIYEVEERIKSSLNSIIKNKGSIDINVREFTLSVNLSPEANLSNRALQTIYCRVDSVLRDYIISNTSDKEILDYVNNTINSIVDSYKVGDSIKFLL